MGTSFREGPDRIVTSIEGRVSAADVDSWRRDFAGLGCAKYWIFEAEGAIGYEPAAVDAAAAMMGAFHKQGKLVCVIAVLKSRMVRMGASLVAMISRVPIEILDSRRDIDSVLKKYEEKTHR